MSVRHRSMGALAPAPTYTLEGRYANCAQLNWVSIGTFSPCYVGVSKEMDDVLTPRFRARQIKGEVFFNDLSIKTVESVIESFGQFTWHSSGAPSCLSPVLHHEARTTSPYSVSYLTSGFPTRPIPTIPLISQLDINDLVVEVTTKGLGARGNANNNLFESVAEYKQALALFTSPLKNIWRFITKNESKIKLLRPDEAWLVYRYGIKPFIGDVTGIIEGLKQKVGHKRQTTRAKGEISKSDVSVVSASPGSGLSATFSAQTTDYCKVRFTSIDEYVATVASNIGFTAKGLITVPWELVPYSFVADWFLNVGDYLNALAPAPGYKTLGSCVVVERGTYTRYQNTGITVTGYTTDTIDASVCHGNTYVKTRSKVGTPGIVIRSDFKLDNLVRASDLLALVSQKLFQLFGKR